MNGILPEHSYSVRLDAVYDLDIQQPLGISHRKRTNRKVFFYKTHPKVAFSFALIFLSKRHLNGTHNYILILDVSPEYVSISDYLFSCRPVCKVN